MRAEVRYAAWAMVFWGCVHYVYCITCDCESCIFREWTWSMGQLWLWLYSVLATFGCGCILNKPTDALTMLVYYCVDVSIIIFVMLGSMPTGFALVVKTETLPGVPNRHVGIGNPANGVVILMPEKKRKEKKKLLWECMVEEPFGYAIIHWNSNHQPTHPHPTQPLTHVPTHIYWYAHNRVFSSQKQKNLDIRNKTTTIEKI